MVGEDRLSMAFAALADPTRRDIIVRLRAGPLTVSDLAARYPMSRPAVSQHVTVLEKAGLVVRDRRAQWNDCRLTTDSLDEAATWISQQQADWTDRFDNLETHLRERRAHRAASASDHGEGDR